MKLPKEKVAKKRLAKKKTPKKKNPETLTDAQVAVIEHYLADVTKNKTRAYLRAHPNVTYDSARSLAARLFANISVRAYLERRQAEIAARLDITPESVAAELAKIGFANADDFFEWGSWGVRLKDSAALPAEMMAAVSEASQSITKDGGSTRIKMHSKVSALDLLSRILGMQKPQEPERDTSPVHLQVTFVSPAPVAEVPAGVTFVNEAGQPESVEKPAIPPIRW